MKALVLFVVLVLLTGCQVGKTKAVTFSGGIFENAAGCQYQADLDALVVAAGNQQVAVDYQSALIVELESDLALLEAVKVKHQSEAAVDSRIVELQSFLSAAVSSRTIAESNLTYLNDRVANFVLCVWPENK